MTAGVPGLSLGGMYYILLCGWMVARDGLCRWRGDAPCAADASRVRRHARLAAGMLLALWGTLRIMRVVLPRFLPPPATPGTGLSARMLDSVWFSVPWLVGVAALMLAGLFGALWVLQRLFPLREAEARPPIPCMLERDARPEMPYPLEE